MPPDAELMPDELVIVERLATNGLNSSERSVQAIARHAVRRPEPTRRLLEGLRDREFPLVYERDNEVWATTGHAANAMEPPAFWEREEPLE
jgi:hypothetical protein